MHDHDDFYLDGDSAKSLGIILQKEMSFTAAEPRVESIEVAGRNGNILYVDNSFNNVKGTAECYCLDTDVAYVITAVNAWMMNRTEYRKLETLVEPEYFRLARLLHGADIEPRLNHINAFTLEFDCKPQKFLKYGEVEVEVQNGDSLLNPTSFTALPIIITHGSGAGTVTINGKTITLTDCDEVRLDSEECDASRNGTNMNATVSGEYPTLGYDNLITFTGGITSVTVIPRWWTL